jgi:hypothetical protein
MIKQLLSLIAVSAFFLASGCNTSTSPSGTTSAVPDYRWMDRTIYFAYSTSETDRNNPFQKQKVQDALDAIASSTSLGEGYFNYTEVDESLLQPVTTATTQASTFNSFVLIWPDAVFSDFVVNQLGGQVPDPNAVTVLDSAYKRKFYIIMKASCFTSNTACNSITSNGINAMVARQLGIMTGMSVKDCATYPNDVMCANTPTDNQWLITSQQSWTAAFNNVLEAILQNPNFYNEYQPPLTD